MLCFKCLAFNKRMKKKKNEKSDIGFRVKGWNPGNRGSRQGGAWERQRRRNSEKQNTEPFQDFHFVINSVSLNVFKIVVKYILKYI